MDFDIPKDLADYLDELDDFIEREIKPLEQEDDNIRFFDHRREDARTDWERGGLPERGVGGAAARGAPARRRRRPLPLPVPEGVRRQGRHQPRHGRHPRAPRRARASGCTATCRTSTRSSATTSALLLMITYGTEEQKAEWVDDLAEGRRGFAFGITEPEHGSDATWMETHAERDGDEWVINGEKTWNTGIHNAQYDLIFARTSGKPGDGDGHHRVPRRRPTRPGFEIDEFLWTFNMPTDHAHISLTERARAATAPIFGGEGRGLQVVQHFFNENRIRQAASSLGAAAVLHRRVGRSTPRSASRSASRWPTNQAHPVPARRAADAVRDAARADPQDGVADGHVRRLLGVRQGVDVQLLGQPAVLRGGRPGDAGARRPGLLAGTSRSSTSTATTAATASPRAPRRSRCAASPATCSAS